MYIFTLSFPSLLNSMSRFCFGISQKKRGYTLRTSGAECFLATPYSSGGVRKFSPYTNSERNALNAPQYVVSTCITGGSHG